jgi:septal ring-binding cell division protein DamX
MRRWSVIGTVLAVLAILLVATGCGVTGALKNTGSTKVLAADSLLAGKYAGAWWSDLFSGGKNEAKVVASLQSTIEQDYTGTLTSAEKTVALSRLATAQTTADQLLADKVLSQADAAKVKAAIADIESSLNKTP